METTQASGLSMMAFAVIIGIFIWIFPGLVLWLTWLLVILTFIGGLVTFMQRG
jgi:UPF0716 family protein affecting phage T7 exclusion